MHPQPRVRNKKHTSLVTTGPPRSPGIPARNGFNGCLRALPGDEFVLSPSSANWRSCRARSGSQNLRRLDASNGRQDHTASPSATRLRQEASECVHIRRSFGEGGSIAVRQRARRSLTGSKPALRPRSRPTLPRPPHPIPTFVTMANAPLSGQDDEICKTDLGLWRRRFFLQRGLDTYPGKLPVGQITRRRHRATRCENDHDGMHFLYRSRRTMPAVRTQADITVQYPDAAI